MTQCEYGEADRVEGSSLGLELPLVTPECINKMIGVEKPEFLKVDVDGTVMDVLHGIFEGRMGDCITFASVEHDDKPEREDYMISKGFSVVGRDNVNVYYRRGKE